MKHQDLINTCVFEEIQGLLFSDLSGPLSIKKKANYKKIRVQYAGIDSVDVCTVASGLPLQLSRLPSSSINNIFNCFQCQCQISAVLPTNQTKQPDRQTRHSHRHSPRRA